MSNAKRDEFVARLLKDNKHGPFDMELVEFACERGYDAGKREAEEEHATFALRAGMEYGKLHDKLSKLEAHAEKLAAELQYFVDRCEGKHPDGMIRSAITYNRYIVALTNYRASQAKE